ncbi:MAG: ComEC/Rec2 family competence protein, partial [Phycisphaerae bacterium]|nr:ComEC/Rec2 family competence protein [Phycisphaerae bacterium]
RMVARMRRAALHALGQHWPAGPQTLGLAQALLLGHRQDMDTRLNEDFRNTGLLHYVSLSGMHFGILVGIVWFLAKTAGLLRPARAAVCGVAAALFLLLVPATAPTLRAAILCWVFCGAAVLRRQGHPVNTLALAAVILLLARPTQLFDVSWQLSFACMLGIFTLSKPIDRALQHWAGLDRPSSPAGTPAAVRLLQRASQGLLSLWSVGLGAWVGSAGISLYHFYGLTPLSAVWTLLVLPGVWLVMTLGLAKIVLAFLIPGLGPAMARLVSGSVDALIWAVHQIAELDLSSLRIGHIGAAPILLYYVLVLLALLAPRRHPVVRRTALAGLAVVVVAWVGWTKWNHTHHPDLRLTCLAVGHGQAAVVQIPGSRALLLDAGSLHRSDIGTRVVNPFLDYAGLSSLDAVAVSHTDADHLNGLPEVFRHVRTHALYADLGRAQAATSQAPEADTLQGSDLLCQSLDEEDIPLRSLAEMPHDWGQGADLALLWPRPDDPAALVPLSDNDRSAVVLIRFGGRRVLLCSDIEQHAQEVLMNLYPDLRADVLVVPHHGSTKTLAPGFVERIDPKVLVCSCSPSQTQGGQVLQPRGGQVAFYTGRDGAITIRLDKSGGIRVAAHLGPAYALGPRRR